MNLYDVFAELARRRPSSPAIYGPGVDDAISYSDLDAAIRTVGVRLAAAAVRQGDCVALHCPSGRDYIIAAYAIWRCGGCVVPIPVELTAAEAQEICRHIAIDFVISSKKIASLFEPDAGQRLIDIAANATLCRVDPQCERPAGFAAIEAAFIRFTSGTTGSSKGVVLSHQAVYERVMAANEALQIGPNDRVVWLLSMSYHFTVTIVGYLSLGAAIVLPANHFAQAVIDATQRHDGTLLYASPTHFTWLAECTQHAPLPSLRLAISTTTALSPETAARFHERYCVPVSQALGIIEVGLPFINLDFAAERRGAVGRVLPAYELRMDDVGLGPSCREVVLRGPGFLDAYYHPWRSRAEIMPDGWFHTGDVGELDGNGCLELRGRSKDVINVLGLKYFPQEVEAVLAGHPGVERACVLASGEVGRLGEVAFARVVLRSGREARCSPNELLEYCRQRLAPFKIPARIEFVPVLPQTASGKTLHREIPQQRRPVETA